MGNAESNLDSKKENEKNNPQGESSSSQKKTNSSNKELIKHENQLETPNPVSYENTFNSNFRLENSEGEPKMANASSSSAGNSKRFGFGLSRTNNYFNNDKNNENELEQENDDNFNSANKSPFEKKTEPFNINEEPTQGNSQVQSKNLSFLKNIKSTHKKNSSYELANIDEKENDTIEKEKSDLTKNSEIEKKNSIRRMESIRNSMDTMERKTSQLGSEDFDNKSQNKLDISNNSLEKCDDSFEIFKPKRKEFIINDFSNLENYVLLEKPDYLIKDIAQYEKNLEDELSKISIYYENIFILSNGVNIKTKVFKDIKEEIARQNTLYNSKTNKINTEQLEKLDIEADDFYRELASRINMAQKKAYNFREKLFKNSSN